MGTENRVTQIAMPTYEDPGCFCKFCCAPCAVYQAQGCKCPEFALGWFLGCWYTMFCWDPTVGKEGAPANQEMERAASCPGAIVREAWPNGRVGLFIFHNTSRTHLVRL